MPNRCSVRNDPDSRYAPDVVVRGKFATDCLPTVYVCDTLWELRSISIHDKDLSHRHGVIRIDDEGEPVYGANWRMGQAHFDVLRSGFSIDVMMSLNAEIMLKLITLRDTGSFERGHSPLKLWDVLPSTAQQRLRDLAASMKTNCRYALGGGGDAIDAYLQSNLFVEERYTRMEEQQLSPRMAGNQLGFITHLFANDLGGLNHPEACFSGNRSSVPDSLAWPTADMRSEHDHPMKWKQ